VGLNLEDSGDSSVLGTQVVDMTTVQSVYDAEKRAFDSNYVFWRWFMIPIPIYLTLPLVRRGVSPNTVTITSILIGLGGSLLLGQGHLVGGVLLVLLWQILDCVDGLIASVTDHKSSLGHFLDMCGAYLMYATVYLAWGIGLAITPDDLMIFAINRWPFLDAPMIILVAGGVASLAATLRLLFSAELRLAGSSARADKPKKSNASRKIISAAYLWMQRNFLEFLGFFLPIMLLSSFLGIGSAVILIYAIAWVLVAIMTFLLCARRLSSRSG